MGVDGKGVLRLDRIWAKTTGPRTAPTAWGRLDTHLADAAGVARQLWDHWLTPASRARVARGYDITEPQARSVAAFLAGVHDVGKASPQFNVKVRELEQPCAHRLRDPTNPAGAPHPLVGALDLIRALDPAWAQARRAGEVFTDPPVSMVLPAVVALHHGISPARESEVLDLDDPFMGDTGIGAGTDWEALREQIVAAARADSGIDDDLWDQLRTREADPVTVMLLTGIVVVSDWISSNVELFPVTGSIGGHAPGPDPQRAQRAWAEVDLAPHSWIPHDLSLLSPDEALSARFAPAGQRWSARQGQTATLRLLADDPDARMVMIEDGTGSGKTEAALLAAETLAARTGARGIYFALPTQATSDAMYSRVRRWMQRLEGVDSGLALVHGNAAFNEDYSPVEGAQVSSIHDPEQSITTVASSWLDGGRFQRALSPFIVGTIDPLLMAATETKHVAVRLLAVSGKVVVLDEIHSADERMTEYLCVLLSWLGDLGVPVVACTATLTSEVRDRLMAAYRRAPSHPRDRRSMDPDPTPITAFPSVSATSRQGRTTTAYPAGAVDKQIMVHWTGSTDPLATADQVLAAANGTGCIALIHTTVDRAQQTYAELLGRGVPAMLLHSRLTDSERRERENRLRTLLGPGGDRPDHLVVVATQVVESSLDVDFDLMGTDLAPMDSLVQRLGRLHRHDRAHTHPPQVWIGGVDPEGPDGVPVLAKAADTVYSSGPVLRTLASLRSRRRLSLPHNTMELFDEFAHLDLPESWGPLRENTPPWQLRPLLATRQTSPLMVQNLNEVDRTASSVPVRGDGSPWGAAVIVVDHQDGTYGLPEWIAPEITLRGPLDDAALRTVARCRVPMPRGILGTKSGANPLLVPLESLAPGLPRDMDALVVDPSGRAGDWRYDQLLGLVRES